MTPTLEMVQNAFYADLLSVPFHQHLGVEIERVPASGKARVTIPPKPEITAPDQQHSPAAVFTLGDAASAVEMCDAIAPRALEMGMGAIFLTVSAGFRPRGPACGTITATTSLVSGLKDADEGEKGVKKSTIVVAASILGEDGELAAEQRVSFYVRFMEEGRMRELVPSSEVGRLAGS